MRSPSAPISPSTCAAASVRASRLLPWSRWSQIVLGYGPAAVLLLIVGIVVAQIAVEVVLATVGETSLRRRVDAVVTERAGDCAHLQQASIPSGTATVCMPCEREGKQWVELRACLDCGNVGCCDDSPGRHATAHHHDSGHPAIATLEPGDIWAYCFDDDVTDPTWRTQRATH